MLTYTSTALIGFVLSLGTISCFKSVANVAYFQPTPQEIQVAANQSNHNLSHRGSGRGPSYATFS
jgi:hypothetical protein